jgi:hypothetical protein
MDRRQVEEKLTFALKSAEAWVPAELLAEMHALVKVGELTMALEALYVQLEAHDVTVPQELLLRLRELSGATGVSMPSSLERKE